ncbi:MAG TPA: protein phosphatase 2C domain-containing protein, partial [Polyangiaceae bacterium]|nr:protein phosphatase 2C domain-containing protein [Polyangiaceae bacterium]
MAGVTAEAGSDMFLIRSYGMTDVGRRRKQNEDAFLRNDDIRLFVVADGMGGHAAGEIASAEAVDTIYGMIKRGIPDLGEETEPLTDDKISRARRLMEGAI